MTGQWRKSSISQGSEHCVEVRFTEDTVYIRDSKYLRDPANDPAAQPTIAIPAADWAAVLRATAGQTSEAMPVGYAIEHLPDGSVTLCDATGVTLTYTEPEWHAFTAGIHLGEFATA